MRVCEQGRKYRAQYAENYLIKTKKDSTDQKAVSISAQKDVKLFGVISSILDQLIRISRPENSSIVE
jgi:hypothetical protein